MIRGAGMAVRGIVTRFRKRWRHVGRGYIRVMRKPDQSKTDWMIRRKEGGTPNRDTARATDVPVRHVQRIRAACLSTGTAPVLRDPGRPGRRITPDEAEAVLGAHQRYCCGAVYLERIPAGTEAIHMPHNVMHRILRDDGPASADPARQNGRSRVRYERTYPDSMRHADYRLPDDGRRLIAYRDDASRLITGHGVSARATGRHATEVPHAAMKRHGRPAPVLTDRGSRSYAGGSGRRGKGASEFGQEPAGPEIRHVPARASRPQTNGKPERFHGELRRKPGHFGTVDRPVHWRNEARPHRSLGWESLEAPAVAFVRKMPPKGTVVKDEQTGESYNVG